MEQKRKKSITYCVLAVEIILLFAAILSGALKEQTVEYFGGDTGEELPENGTEIELPRGSYEITFTYDATDASSTIQAYADTSYGRVYGELVSLHNDQNEKTFEHYQYESTDCFGFEVKQTDDASFQINEMYIVRNGKMDRAFCVTLFFVFLFADSLLYLVQKKKIWEHFSQEQRNVCIGLLIIFILSLVPLYTNYFVTAHDSKTHIMRIECLAEALHMGQFPVRMQPGWLNDYGYPISVLYGDLFLYIPAFLRLIGYSLMNCYKIYIGLISLGTVLASYFCFKNISRSYYMGLLGSFLYTLSFYRIINVYTRSAAGEYTSMLFMPLVFLALYRILHTEGNEKKRYALMLILSYTGILQSHTLSFEMVILFTVLYCLCFGKLFWKNILFFIKTAALTLLLNLSFLLPFADYMISHAMNWGEIDGSVLQAHGVFLAQLFQTFNFGGYLSKSVSEGTVSEMPLSIGLALVLAFFLFFWQYSAYYKQLKAQVTGENRHEQYRIAGLMLLSVFMACWFFPWKWIANIPAIGKYLVPYRYPWRFFAYATMFGVFLVIYVLNNMDILKQYILKKITIGVLCLFTIVNAFALYDRMLSGYNAVIINSSACFDSARVVAGGEYLLEDADIYDTYSMDLKATEGLEILYCEREHYRISVELENQTGDEQTLVLPLYAYKGFVVKDVNTNEQLETDVEEETMELTVLIPAGYSGEIKVDFKEPWYWRISELVSLAMLVFLILWYYKKLRKEKPENQKKVEKKRKK